MSAARGMIVAVVLSATLLAIAAGCSRTPALERGGDQPLQRRLTITGSSTMAPLVGEIARRFEARRPGVRVDVQTGGSSRGIADVRRALADVGMVSRATLPEETDLRGHAIALDGITLIVHRDNPVASLDERQVSEAFTGEITNWRELGGADAPITVVNKAEGRSTLELFLAHFELHSGEIVASVVIGDNQHGIRTVAGDPQAIGYVSIGTAEYEQSRGTAIRMLPVGGVDATLENVQRGSFPLVRPLNLVTFGQPSPLAREFLDFARSAEVHDLVEAQYFVPLAP